MMIWWYWNFRWRFDWRNGTNAPKVWSEALWSMHCVLRKNGSGTTMFPQMDAWTKVLGGSYNLSLELCVDCTRSGQNGRTLPGSGTYRRNILSLNISELRLKFGRRARKFRIGIYITALQVRCHTVFQLAEKLKRQKKISCWFLMDVQPYVSRNSPF